MTTRADLHVHSRYSDRPSEWILRRIGAPECYTEPRRVYDTAKRRGMQFVTISDHNCIDGALEIAHLPGTFISNEITAYFPDDGCKVHVLCWGITPAQFAEIERLRENIVELRDYMHADGIVHACAHPLYSVNDRLTVEHFERLLILFNVFETMNGGRHRRGNELVASIVSGLTRDTLDRLSEQHRMAPVGTDPWRKGTTGGSDDHSGAFIAKGFTECPEASTPAAFLDHVGARRSRPGGIDGTPLSFAHSLYSIGYQYYRDKLRTNTTGNADLVRRMMEEVLGRDQTQVRFKDRVSYFAGRLTGRGDRRGPVDPWTSGAEMEFKRLVSTEMARLFGQDWLCDDFALNSVRYWELNQRTFELASRISNHLFFQFSRRFVTKLSSGSVFGSLQALSAVGPVVLGIAPYLFAFAHQNRDKAFLAEVSRRFLQTPAPADKVACFVDMTADSDERAILAAVDQLPETRGADRTIVSFGKPLSAGGFRTKHFASAGNLAVPEHEVQLAFPPILELLDYCDEQQFTSIVVAAPGLAGLAMVAIGKLIGARVIGLYETTLPTAVREATGDEGMEAAAWRYVRWFYDQAAVVYAPSDAAARTLVVKGLDRAKIQVLPVTREIDRMFVEAV